ncbi:MAG: hypothetical protein LW595_00955 [Rickettsiales bacterium]|jgi:K+-sensing histidine kinase KdpD|nr:hypothetical protein [Rickettsiales bacterium]
MKSNINNDKPLIILCIDTNNLSKNIIKYSFNQAKKMNCNISLLTIIESSNKNLIFGANALRNQQRNQIEKDLKKIVDEMNEEDIIPIISIREGEILKEIIAEIQENKNCKKLLLSKSRNIKSDNSLLPRLVNQIGNKIKIPISIIPEYLTDDFF